MSVSVSNYLYIISYSRHWQYMFSTHFTCPYGQILYTHKTLTHIPVTIINSGIYSSKRVHIHHIYLTTTSLYLSPPRKYWIPFCHPCATSCLCLVWPWMGAVREPQALAWDSGSVWPRHWSTQRWYVPYEFHLYCIWGMNWNRSSFQSFFKIFIDVRFERCCVHNTYVVKGYVLFDILGRRR